MNNELTKRMGTAPVLGLLLKMSLPMMVSMLVTALYNIVDSYFVSMVSREAYDAVTLSFPMQMLVLAVGLGVSVGTNAIVSRRLGERNVASASELAQTGLFLSLVMSALFGVTGYGISYVYLLGFTKNNPEVFSLGMMYLPIVTSLSFGLMLELIGEKTLQATGNTKIPMLSQLIGAIFNIALDPLFIFVFDMGIAGAAVATVLGQIFAMIFILVYIARHNPGIDMFFKSFKLHWSNIRAIINIGVPTFVMNAVTAFTTITLNAILEGLHSITAVTVLGSYFKLQSFVFMPVFGLSQGAFPIMNYNYGAHDKKRFVDTFKWMLIISVGIMVVGTVIFQVIPDKLMLIFHAEGELLTMGSVALREISWCFIGAAFGISITNMFQALGHGMCSMLMSLLRQVVLLIPTVWIFGAFLGIDAAWYGYPFAEAITLVVFTPIAIISLKRDFERAKREDKDKTLALESDSSSDNIEE